MKLSRVFLVAWAVLSAVTAQAQGGNHGDGGPDGDFTSLSERLLNLEKKHHGSSVYIDYSNSFQLENSGNQWSGAFRARNLRLEIKGSVGDHLTYRLRQRLNTSSAPGTWESFSRATDFMMLGWKFNDKFTLMGGKMCQYWGGYDYDENPLYIYQYCDQLNAMEIFYAGAALAWYPAKGQEIVFNVTNSYNNSFAHEYGAALLSDGTNAQAADFPLSYILAWNGHIGNNVETRWGGGFINQAKGYQNYMVMLGQKLTLPSFQVYLDLAWSLEQMDRLMIATGELGGTGILKDVVYESAVVKSNWQFSPGWNLMTKVMYDIASTPDHPNYRNAFGYAGSLEYYPIKNQDLRVFVAYIGHHARYTVNTIPAGNSGRLEIGLMYRIKAY